MGNNKNDVGMYNELEVITKKKPTKDLYNHLDLCELSLWHAIISFGNAILTAIPFQNQFQLIATTKNTTKNKEKKIRSVPVTRDPVQSVRGNEAKPSHDSKRNTFKKFRESRVGLAVPMIWHTFCVVLLFLFV